MTPCSLTVAEIAWTVRVRYAGWVAAERDLDILQESIPMEVVERSVRFTLRGIEGAAFIRYEVNRDPSAWGFDRLGHMDPSISRGFPVIDAKVEYPAKGYLGILGWIQVVDYFVRDGAKGEERFVVAPDVAPQARDANIPYLSYGIQPRLFDAPAFDKKNVDWIARSFLTYTPDLLMTPVVAPLCGFSWGYTVTDGAVAPKALQLATLKDWLHARMRLRTRLPKWTFLGDEWQPPVFDE